MRTLLSTWQRLFLLLFAAAAAGTVSIGARVNGLLQPLELAHYDLTAAFFASDKPVADVVLIPLTDGELSNWGWPVPDDKLALLVTAALDAGAKAVGIDIYRDMPVGQGRKALMAALSDPRVITIYSLNSAGAAGPEAPAEVRKGFSDIPIDQDGVARRALILVNQPDGIAFSLPMQLSMTFTGQTDLRSWPQDTRVLLFGSTPVRRLTGNFGPYRSLDARGYQVMRRYLSHAPIIRQVGASALLSGNGRSELAGKAVLIGVTSQTVKDFFQTPLTGRSGPGFAYGAEIHAVTAQQLIDHAGGGLSPLVSVSEALSNAGIIAAALGGGLIALFIHSTGLAVFLGFAGSSLLLIAGSWAHSSDLLLPAGPAAMAWLLSFLLGIGIVLSRARSQRRVLARIFSSQLSDELAAQVWKQRESILSGQRPRPRRLFITVLIADIEGSTRIGKAMEPKEFMAWISRLLNELGRVSRENGGFVEKFTGDGILAVFGAPVASESWEERRQDAISALECARRMRVAIADLNKKQPDMLFQYKVRIGLNSGEAIAGMLGSDGSMRYNIIGDTVNIAARLEAWSKHLPPDAHGQRPICFTEATSQLIGAQKSELYSERMLHDDGSTQIKAFTVSPGS